jgi:hypothetical protein
MKDSFDEAFARAEAAFRAADKLFEQQPKFPSDHIRINFSGRRGATFFKFIGCALDILFTGKTTLVVKKTIRVP